MGELMPIGLVNIQSLAQLELLGITLFNFARILYVIIPGLANNPNKCQLSCTNGEANLKCKAYGK